MLDIRLIRENPDLVRKDLKRRGEKEKLKWLDSLLDHDRKWRLALKRMEQLRREKNILTERISQLKRQGKDSGKEMAEVRQIPEKIRSEEEKTQKYREKVEWYLMRLPNILHKSVPAGKDEHDNVEIRKKGKPPRFDFKPKNHLEIMEGLGLVESERAAKVAGSGFFYLKGNLVLLDFAIMRYAMDFLQKKGFTIIEPPFMIHRKPYEGVTDLADFESVMYKIEKDDLYLIATSEHSMAAMHMDETMERRELPIKLCGVSPCFRREVGAHGKYTKGLFRTHQFNKVEQFIFCLPEQSWTLHEEIQKNSEQLYQSLGLAYRVVNICTGDIGNLAAKKYDIEIWMADGKYREIGSNSNCTDYQARRLNIKFRDKEGQPPAGYVHTLNNTALATSRTMMAILEQFQRKDGSVLIPKVLWPYMNGIKKLERRQ